MAANVAATESAIGNPGKVGGRSGNPVNEGMASCLPEQLIENYNQCMSWNEGAPARLSGYLFWGAEYWLLRQRNGDPRYLRAFARVLEES